MERSGIPDISADESGGLKVNWLYLWAQEHVGSTRSIQKLKMACSLFVWCIVDQLQEKFRLDLDDEEAIHFFQDLINDSVSALFPQMVETIHRWAQYWR
jgi:phosphatidylinositol 3-kinase